MLNEQLKEKDATIVSLEKNFESKLSYHKEEQIRLLNKAKDEKLSLKNRLELANNTITGLGRELQSEKHKIEQLQVNIEDLEVNLEKSRKKKDSLEEILKVKDSSITFLQERVNFLSSELKEKEDNIEGLRSSLVQKDSVLTKLDFSFKQAKNEVDSLKSEILNMKNELLKYRNESEEKNSMLANLNGSIDSLTVERDNLQSELNKLESEYDKLSSYSEKKLADNKRILEEKESEIGQVNEKYEMALKDVNAKEGVISDLTRDRDNLKKILDLEVKHGQSLNQELQLTKETLESLKTKASDLDKQLKESRKHLSELEVESQRVKAEFTKSIELLQKSLDKETLHSETLSSELSSVKEALNKTKKDLEIVSSNLSATSKNCTSLQNELIEAYKRIDIATNDLKEEREVVASLKNQLKFLEEQILTDKEARIFLETSLKEATNSLDEMNRNALGLLKDLEASNSRISSLEEEREFLNNAFEKEKKIAQDARENLEDAQSVITRLGTERENLLRKGKKLGEHLASAKGEILRLRAQVRSLETEVNSKPKQESGPVSYSESEEETEPIHETEQAVNTTTKPAKKTTRRRRASNR